MIGAVCLVVIGLAATAPGDVGTLLAGAAVGAVVAYVVLSDPLLALLLVLAASFFRLAQREIVSTEALTPAVILLLVSLTLAIARHAKMPPKLGAVEWLMAVYLAWNILSWLLPHPVEAIEPVTGAPILVYRWIYTGVLLPFLVYVIAKSVIDDERGARWLLWTTVAMAAYSSWVSILQFHGPKSLVWPRYIVDAPNWEGRANGIFNQPVVNGVILVIGFVVCLFLASRPGVKRSVQVVLYGLAAANAYSVYLTHTRAALLALIVVLGMGILLAPGWRRGFVAFTVLGMIGVAANASSIFSSDRSDGGVGSSTEVYDRLNLMATAMRAMGEHPFVGIGLARFQFYNTDHHVAWSQDVPWDAGYAIISHENEFGIGAELGIPGVLMWLAVIVAVVWMLWRAMRELPRDTYLGSAFAFVGASAMVTMIVNGLTVDLRILDFAMILPFMFAGMVAGALERHRDDQATRRPRPGVVGGGLPTGMSLDDQQRWLDDHPAGEPARAAARPVAASPHPVR
ncbi:O-antigen ligase family protein [Actinomycetospora sp. NBRC 106375]|uniref:O-antigen ligase family protein n=1 Tax=Actinomycetospora sp. NBRC 106375 TaxID=3032207 RepID=UPI0025531E08|nr:O-antigen ligase family protein [Actinomycetospora sp. NBRC 106375]